MHLYGYGRLATLIFTTVLMLDQLTKWFTDRFIPMMSHSPSHYPYGGIGVFKSFMGVEFSISHLTNYGAAWGVMADFQIYLLALRIALILGLAYYTLFLNRNPSWVIPLTMVLAGAIGNVIDYFSYGHVVDMIHFIFWGYDYPVFNLADSAVFLGVTWIGISAVLPAQQLSYHRR